MIGLSGLRPNGTRVVWTLYVIDEADTLDSLYKLEVGMERPEKNKGLTCWLLFGSVCCFWEE